MKQKENKEEKPYTRNEITEDIQIDFSKINKTKAIAWFLGILLVIAVSYIFITKYQENRQAFIDNIYQQGRTAGQQEAIFVIGQEAIQCKQIPFNVGNQTINLVAVECLEKEG